jgi:hypothetical protein
MKTFSLDSFKDAVKRDNSFAESIVGKSDSIDYDNGSAIIHRCNLSKYLEKYLCKDEDDLSNTLWYSYGIFVHVVD